MARGSGVSLYIHAAKIPELPEALAMYERGMTTGVNASIHDLVDSVTRFDRSLPLPMRELLVDPQTSGGLLVAVDHARANALVRALLDHGVSDATIIGHVAAFEAPHHLVFD